MEGIRHAVTRICNKTRFVGTRVMACFVILLMSLNSSRAVSIVERSPFIGPDFTEGSSDVSIQDSVPVNSEYELHGVYELGGKTHVLLKAISNGRLEWYKVGTNESGLYPKRYDAENDVLLISIDNSEVRLQLQELGEFKSIPIAGASGPIASTTSVATRRSNPSLSTSRRASSSLLDARPIIRSLPRSPIDSSTRSSSRSQMRESFMARSSSRPAGISQQVESPDTTSSPQSKPPRGAPELPINFPEPPDR